MDVSAQPIAILPSRILFIRPDAYGDIVLFEPVLRLLAELPQVQVAVLVRESYLDVNRLFPDGVCWIGSGCDPYRYGPDAEETRQALEQLRKQVAHFEPDCVVAACYSKTWFEAVVASWLPATRKISLGPYKLDLVSACALEERWPEAKTDLFTERIDVPWDMADWQKNIKLAEALLGKPLSSKHKPQIRVSDGAGQWARHKIAELGLIEGEYIACCPAGTATVRIKTWPAEGYAAVLEQLARKHGLQPLLLGARSELPVLEKIRHLAAKLGLKAVVFWTGEGGDIDHLAALLSLARLYVGNDTGAMHLSAALNVHGVAVFGGGTWPRFCPAGSGFVTVVQPLPCFGCGWRCPLGDAPCIKRIPVNEVCSAVDLVIQEPPVAAGKVHEVSRLLTEKEAAHACSWRVQGLNVQKRKDAASVLHLLRQLRESEADRAARLKVIEAQGQELGRISQLETEKVQLEAEKVQLSAQLQASEADRVRLYSNWLVRIGIKTGLVSPKIE